MYIATSLNTYFFGKYVGNDEYGNKYFRSANKKNKNEKRWVIYNGVIEPSKIPARWHMWLHYTTNELPNLAHDQIYAWQKKHTPNFTLTKHAYNPCANKSALYESYNKWTPK